MDEHEVVYAALKAFSRETGLKGTLLALGVGKDDCKVTLEGHDLTGHIQRWASHKVPLILQRITPGDSDLLLADYVNANTARKLQDAGIQFIDTAGNAFVDLPGLKIRIRGNRSTTESHGTFSKTDQMNRAFQSKGLIIIYHLLIDERLLTLPTRDMASRFSVAHGTVNIVLRTLENSGFLVRNRGRSTIVDSTKLMERWVQGYAEKLSPKLLIGEFLDESPQWWGSSGVTDFDAVWGGEIAGRDYTQYLHPEVATLYLPNGTLPRIMQQYRLRKPPTGMAPNIRLMQRFWQTDTAVKELMTSPLLTYAELIASNNARNFETARLIRDRYLTDPQNPH